MAKDEEKKPAAGRSPASKKTAAEKTAAGKKPAKKAAAGKQASEKKPGTKKPAGKPAATKAAAKNASAERPARKGKPGGKPAAGKPAVKKTAPKRRPGAKPAAEKPAAEKAAPKKQPDREVVDRADRAARQKVRESIEAPRMASFKPIGVAAEIAGARTLAKADAAKRLGKDVIVGRRGLKDAAVEGLEGLRGVVQATVQEAGQENARQIGLGGRLVEALGERRAGTRPAAAEGDFVLQGRVVDEKSGEPLRGLVVHAHHAGLDADGAFGIDVTDDEGRYSISMSRDLALMAKGRVGPLQVCVGADSGHVLQETEAEVDVSPGDEATVDLSVKAEHAGDANRISAGAEKMAGARMGAAASRQVSAVLQSQLADALGRKVIGLIDKGLARLDKGE